MRRRQVVEGSRTWLGGDFVRRWHLRMWSRGQTKQQTGQKQELMATRTFLIQVPNLRSWLIETFITVTALWPQCILNLWKITISLVTKGRVWTKIHCPDPTSWRTAFTYTCICVCGFLYFSNWRVGSKDSCWYYRLILCVCVCACKFWLHVYYSLCWVIISLAKLHSRVSEWRNQGWDGKNGVCQASVQLH